MLRDFLKIKAKPLTNFCYFRFFTTWLGVEIKAQKHSQARLECDLLGPPWSLCLMSWLSKSPGSDLVGDEGCLCCSQVRIWGDLRARLPHPTSASLGSGLFPPCLGLPDSGDPRGGGSSLNKLQPQPEAVSEVMGAGDLGVVAAEVPRRSEMGFLWRQAWERAGWEMSLAMCRPQNGP